MFELMTLETRSFLFCQRLVHLNLRKLLTLQQRCCNVVDNVESGGYMSENEPVGYVAGQIEVGKYLSTIRERAGIRQAELARKITWSPAVLSRVESGDRSLAPDELESILKA